MKAAVMHGPYDIRIDQCEKPQISDGDALIKIKAVGLCGGDVHNYEGNFPYKHYPFIFGHEMSGVITEMGDDTSGFELGDRVIVDPMVPCGKCYPCRVGKYNCCSKIKFIGTSLEGGFGEYVRVPIKNLLKMPNSFTFELGALVEPYTIGGHCVMNRAKILQSDTVLIIGAGAIGITILDLCKMVGARTVVCDISPFRLSLAKKFGADIVINSKEENLEERIMEITCGEGASAVFEATGISRVMASTPDLVANGGRIVIVGLTTDDVPIKGLKFTNKEMNILGSRNSANMFPFIIDCFEKGKLHPKMLLTNTFPFEDAVESFKYVAENIRDIGKAVMLYDTI